MLPQAYLIVLALALISGITTLIGVGIAFWMKKNVNAIVIGIGFSAGIMLAITFFELLPESIFATGRFSATFAFVLGFAFLLIVHYTIPHIHLCHEKGKCSRIMGIGMCVTFGMILHDFPEGFAMANSYLYMPALGILVAIAVAIHNIPEQFAMAVPLVMIKQRKFLFKMASLAALAEPLGAAVGLAAASLAPSLTPAFMAFAGGAMIFVSIDELYPLAQQYKRPMMFGVGIALSLVVYFGLSYFF
jgi:ZIP family zinc transporter